MFLFLQFIGDSMEQKHAKKLFHFTENNGYEIVRDYLCEVVVELPIENSKDG